MAAFGANSSSSSKSCSQGYDVFINHRGPDIKHTFATALYRNLEDHGVRVFFDKSEMQAGDNIAMQLEEAIRDATVHVAIFTPKYAESNWCLEELCLMVESAKSDRATNVVPVFHNIKPADLRWTDNDKSGPYAVALRQHEEKQPHGSEKVQNWRNALSYVADISGLDLAAFKGGELELLSEVVQTVVKNVPKPLLFVAKHPTGIQQKVEEFTSKVLQGLREEEQAKVVGIVGSGGVGKTTMAKQFFNANGSIYGKSSFLADVAKMSLKSLQRQLIKDLKGRDIEIQSSDEGVGVLERNLSNCYALIVLDDIDHVDQLDAFLPIKNVLHPNSLLVVTSRDKQVLKSADIEESFIYHLKELNTQHSRELFCRHAFKKPHIPPPDFNDFVNGLSKACYGLPLALKVLGASLCGNDDKSYWEEQLNGLDQIFPKEIQERLRVSYDSLNHQQKQIFLDIACFCLGEESDKWKKVWSGSGWQGHVALRTLQDKCLIELDTENTIKMHDLLIVMGRNIAQEQSLPIRRCCGTSRKVFDLLHESLTNKIEVRGIRMDPPRTKNEESFRVRIEKLLNSTEKKFQIENLQILEGEGDFVEGMLKLSTNLISLRWNNCRCSRLPSFPMQDLRVLEVNGMELGRLWEDQDQAPEELLQLNIDAPQLEFLPKSLGKLRHLEKLVVRSTRLTTMPESLRDLRNLQHIALVGCENLGMLPDSFENLTNLRHVDLTMCKSLRVLPDSMEKLKEVLEFISLYSCKNLEKIPNWLLDSKSLNLDPIQQWLLDNENPSYPIRTTRIAEVHICHEQQEVYYDFTGFSSLKMLPDSLRYVYFLRHSNSQMHNDVTTINLTGCESLRVLPEFLGEFTSLRYVNLGLCKTLEVLPESFGKLEVLRGINLSGCESLSMLPHSWGSPYLRHLHLKGCRSLTISTETLGNLTDLECLDLSCCPQMELLPSKVGRQRFLKKLNLLDTMLKELHFYDVSFTYLKVLRVGSPLLEVLPASLGYLKNLEELWLHGCEKLQCLPGSIEMLTQLRELNMQKCGIQSLPAGVMKMTELRMLAVHRCPLRELPFGKVEGEKGLLRLNDLQLNDTEICEVSFPEGVCPDLQHLSITYCNDLVEVRALPTTLKSLDLSGCRALMKTGGICDLGNLRTLNLSECDNIQVEALPGLPTLISSNCRLLNTPLDISEEKVFCNYWL